MTTEEQLAAEQAAAEAKAAEEAAAAEEKPKTAEELKAEAEALEAENKQLKAEKEKGEIEANMARRLEKAKAKNAELKGEEEAPSKSKDLGTRDLLILDKNEIEEGSEKHKILEKFSGEGKPYADYKEAIESAAVKAEFEALDAKNDAKTIVDKNDNDEVQLKTKKEAVAAYRASGELPDDPTIQEAIVDDNLKEMGLK